MTALNFVSQQTVISATWLNGVDLVVYGVGHPSYAGGGDPTGVTSCSAAITAAGSIGTNVIVTFPRGVWRIDTAPTPTGNVSFVVQAGASFIGANATYITAATGPNQQVLQKNTRASDIATNYIRRNADHTGGTAGLVSCGFRVDNYVSSGATNYEWGILGVVYNSASVGDQVGGYFQGNKVTSGSCQTWGAVCEVIENVAITNPTTGTVGLEVDVRSNGTDNNTARIAVDVVCTRGYVGGVPAGVATETSYGFRVQTARDGANSVVKVGYGFDTVSTNVQVGFDTSGATITSTAYRMAAGQTVGFNVTGANRLYYDNTGIRYDISGVLKSRLNDNGSIALAPAVAIPAGGTAGIGLLVSSATNFGVFFGSGVPSLSAAKGSLYLRSDGSGVNDRMYVNTDGGTTWTAVVTVA